MKMTILIPVVSVTLIVACTRNETSGTVDDTADDARTMPNGEGDMVAVPFESVGGNIRKTCSENGYSAILLVASSSDAACDLDTDNPDRVVLTLHQSAEAFASVELNSPYTLGTDVDFSGHYCSAIEPCTPINAGTVEFSSFSLSGDPGDSAASGSLNIQLGDGSSVARNFEAYLCRAEYPSCPSDD